MSSTEDEDEATSSGAHGRPNAWWADHKEDAPASFTGAFRGVPSPRRGGQQTVRPEDVHGSLAYCWCGEPADHEWPGKAGGAPHPKKGTTMSETIDRRMLRAYHSTLQQFILHAVNEVGLRYAIRTNKVLLYPPDGSRAVTIHARNSEQQVNSLVKWWREHVPDPIQQSVAKGEVTPAAVAALAEKVNSPEHEVKKAPAKAVAKKVEPKPATKPAPDSEWVPYTSYKGKVLENYETDGTTVRCRVCLGTDNEWSTTNVKAIAGHTRTRHVDTSTMWGPEAQAKKVLTREANRTLRGKMNRIIGELIEAVDYPIADEARIAELEQENAELRAKVEDAEARLALIKESLNI